MPHSFGPEYVEKESCGRLLKLRVGNKGNLKPLKVVIRTVCKCGRCLSDIWVYWLDLCYLIIINVVVFIANPYKRQAPYNTKVEGAMGDETCYTMCLYKSIENDTSTHHLISPTSQVTPPHARMH